MGDVNKTEEKETTAEPEKIKVDATPTPRRRRNPIRNAEALKRMDE